MDNNSNDFQEVILYKDANGNVKVDVFIVNEDLWLAQAKLALLFDVDRSVITKHLKNSFNKGELDKDSTYAKTAQVETEGQRSVKREVEFYNLDATFKLTWKQILKSSTFNYSTGTNYGEFAIIKS